VQSRPSSGFEQYFSAWDDNTPSINAEICSDLLLSSLKDSRRLLGGKFDRLQNGVAMYDKKLKGFKNKYRLRAGNYRALFELEGGTIVVYDVGDRKDIYE